jgi:hypothetical protein
MIEKLASILGINKYVSEDTIKKGLQKLDPRFKKFFSEAGKYGYPAGAAIGFLKSQFGGQEEQVNQNLRPDEAANIELKRQKQGPENLLKTGLNVGLGAAIGGGIGNLVGGIGSTMTGEGEQPQEEASPLSKEGIGNQISPGMGKEDQGIERLFGFIDKKLSEGNPLEKAVSQARSSAFFKPVISALEQRTGMPFLDLIKSKYSQGQGQQQVQGMGDKGAFLMALQQLASKIPNPRQ